jgi:chromate transporter
MLYWQIFLAFFIPNIIGYGGGPPSIPLVQAEVVDHYGWMTNAQFSQILALANSLPGPIATKLAGYIGYEIGGVWGAIIGLFASMGPTVIAMLLLMSLLVKFKDSPRIKAMTGLIYPAIAILMALLAVEFLSISLDQLSWIHTLILAAVALFLLQKMKIHPAWVIVGSFLYGALLPVS